MKLAGWSRKNDDLFSFKTAMAPVSVLNIPEVLEDLCAKRRHFYSSRPMASEQAELCCQNKTMVIQPYGEEWRMSVLN